MFRGDINVKMRFKRRKLICYILLIDIFVLLGISTLIKLVYSNTNHSDYIRINIESVQENELVNNKIKEIYEKNYMLKPMLVNIQEKYIESQWFHKDLFGIPYNYAENGIIAQAGDLENVLFYISSENKFFFIPTSMVNKTILTKNGEVQVCEYQDDDKMHLYLYSYEIYNPEPQRVIYPKPGKGINIYSCNVDDFIDDLYLLGTAEVSFPVKIPDKAAKLYENEYTEAIKDLIHSSFFSIGEYDNYQIYIGDYNYDEYISRGETDYTIRITVAIVGEKNSYWWIFRAKELLGEDGRVILESSGGNSYSSPCAYDANYSNVYAPMIDNIIYANRLMIPLTITEDDEVKELELYVDENDINMVHYRLK